MILINYFEKDMILFFFRKKYFDNEITYGIRAHMNKIEQTYNYIVIEFF